MHRATFPIPNGKKQGAAISQTKKLIVMRNRRLKSKTLNYLAKETFARFANDFSKDWIPVNVAWMGDYNPEDEKNSPSGNFLPECGRSYSDHHEECSIFGWSYREGIKEGILTKKEKNWENDFTFIGMLRYILSAKKEVPCTLQEVLANMANEMPYLSHFAIYTASEQAEHAEFELYKIPKYVFQFNSKM